MEVGGSGSDFHVSRGPPVMLIFDSRHFVVFLEQAERELACLHCLISQAQAFIHCAPTNLIDQPKNCHVCLLPFAMVSE